MLPAISAGMLSLWLAGVAGAWNADFEHEPQTYHSALGPQALEAWREDIAFLRAELPRRHINLFHRISKADFHARLDALEQKLPQMTNIEVELAIWRMTHAIGGGHGDGHTATYTYGRPYRYVPLRFDGVEGDMRIVGAGPGPEDLLGAKILSIGDHDITDVTDRIAAIVPFVENDQSRAVRVSRYFGNLDILKGLGVLNETTVYPVLLQHDDGRKEQLSIPVGEGGKRPRVATMFKRKSPALAAPRLQVSTGLWATHLPQREAVYIYFARYPSRSEMADFADDAAQLIRETNAKNLIIDMRDNFGGDLFTGISLAARLNLEDGLDWENGIYALTGKKTFSAAMVNAAQFRQLLNAKLVGEPTGGNPSGYQDMGSFNLPNSDLMITYSKRLFRLQQENSKGVQPGVMIPATWNDMSRGHDAALAWIIEDITSRK